MNAVFLDTVGLIAVWDEDDQWHDSATRVYDVLMAGNERLVTTTLVLYECGNAAARRPYRDQVCALREETGLAGDLYEPTPADLDAAWADYARGLAGSAGIVDQVSFAVMRRLGLSRAFTNDRHFTAAGFTVLF
jgi:predicted nucleic acid-binding protein